MKAIRWLGRKLRGPAWYAWNIVEACWMFNLRDMAEKPGQKPLKRFVYRMVITVESVLEALFMFAVIQIVGTVAAIALPTRWAVLEIKETWFPYKGKA